MRISDWSSDMCSSDLGGKSLIAVPANQWMWSAHDVVNHDHRRYSKASLAKAIADAGLTHSGLRWFNSLLFPAAVAARAWGKLTGKDDSDDSPPPKPDRKSTRLNSSH